MVDSIFNAANLINFGFLFYCVALMVRDELKLRSLLLIGILCNTGYYMLYPDPPLWNAVINNAVICLINIVLIVIIVHERTLWAMAPHELELFHRFGVFTPGQFRKLMRVAHWDTVEHPTQLTKMGEVPDRLWFVIDGDLEISKADGVVTLDGDKFIGEIAYLQSQPASATVSALPGTQVVSWETDRLRRITSKTRALDHAITVMLSQDMAHKVAGSMPRAQTAGT